MKKPLVLLSLSLASGLLAAAALQAQEAPQAPAAAPAAQAAAPKSAKDFTVLRLGPEEIKNSEAEEVWSGLFPGGSAPDFGTFDETIRQNVLKGMVSERLLLQEAAREGFDKSEEVKKRLEVLEKQVILQTFMESKAKSLVTEAQLKEAYAKKAAAMKNEEEVKAKHILVGTEEEAKDIVKELKKGTDFAKLAKEKSMDKASGAQGGDLGWFTKERMVPEFAAAAFNLKKGDVSEPVKSSFGWHVIQLEDRRKVTIPPFEQMREELQGEISAKAVQDYVEALLKRADIKYFGADGREKPFSRSLQPEPAAAAPAAATSAKP